MLLQYSAGGNPSAVGAATGAICGLVVITPCAGYVTAFTSAAIGMLGATSSFMFSWLDRSYGVMEGRSFFGMQVSNPLDVFSVHGVPGLCGSLLTAVFALPAVAPDDPRIVTGVLYGGSFEVLMGSIEAVAFTSFYAIGMTVFLLWLLQQTLGADGLLSAQMFFSGHVKSDLTAQRWRMMDVRFAFNKLYEAAEPKRRKRERERERKRSSGEESGRSPLHTDSPPHVYLSLAPAPAPEALLPPLPPAPPLPPPPPEPPLPSPIPRAYTHVYEHSTRPPSHRYLSSGGAHDRNRAEAAFKST